MSLDPIKLKKTALQAQKNLKLTRQTEDLDTKDVQDNVKKITEYINEWAAKGLLELKYDFSKTSHSRAFINAVAQKFKDQNPKLMVITDHGNRHIVIDWSGKNEV